MKHRLLPLLLLPVLAASLNSCATQQMIARAQGNPGPLDGPGAAPAGPQPAYYALVPLVLPIDLVAWPFEYFYMKNRQPSGPPVAPPSNTQFDPGPLPQARPYRQPAPVPPPPGQPAPIPDSYYLQDDPNLPYRPPANPQ